jgi:hypothetical protein
VQREQLLLILKTASMPAQPGSMKTNVLTMLALLSAFLCVGCRYDLAVTQTPSQEVDRSLLGRWQIESVPDRIQISSLDKHHYKLEMTRPQSPFFKSVEMMAFHAKVGTVELIVLRMVGPPDLVGRKDYDYYMFTKDGPDRLVARAINPEFARLDAKTPEMLWQQITNAATKTNLFSSTATSANRISVSK